MADSTQVLNPAQQQNADGSFPSMLSDRHGALLVSELHGKRYSKGVRGNLFWGTGVATLKAAGGTTAGFMLYNPASSPVYLEVEKFRFSTYTTVTEVIAGLLLEGSIQVPSGTLTGGTISGMPLAARSSNVGIATASSPSNGRVYLGATITAMTLIGGLGINVGATTYGPPIAEVDFDGTLILAPGMAINVCSSIVQTNTSVCDFIWSEWKP